MTTMEVLDACGRAPSGSEVVVRMMQHNAMFGVAAMRLEYERGEWRVIVDADLNDERSVA